MMVDVWSSDDLGTEMGQVYCLYTHAYDLSIHHNIPLTSCHKPPAEPVCHIPCMVYIMEYTSEIYTGGNGGGTLEAYGRG